MVCIFLISVSFKDFIWYYWNIWYLKCSMRSHASPCTWTVNFTKNLGIPIMEIRRSHDQVIFIMWILIPKKDGLYIATEPRRFGAWSSPLCWGVPLLRGRVLQADTRRKKEGLPCSWLVPVHVGTRKHWAQFTSQKHPSYFPDHLCCLVNWLNGLIRLKLR